MRLFCLLVRVGFRIAWVVLASRSSFFRRSVVGTLCIDRRFRRVLVNIRPFYVLVCQEMARRAF